MHKSDGILTSPERRRVGLSTVLFVRLLLCLVFFAGFAAGATACSDAPSARITTPGPSLPFAVADFDGDLRPDVVGVQIGRSGVSFTDYWIQFQLSAAGQHRILVVAPTGGLQIAVRDVNGDHALDLVLTTTWLKQPVAILLNDGHGGFTRVAPADFPQAFGEPKSRWSSSGYQALEAVGIPPRPRAGACLVFVRLQHHGSLVGTISPSIQGILLNHFLLFSPGRSPPAVLQLL